MAIRTSSASYKLVIREESYSFVVYFAISIRPFLYQAYCHLESTAEGWTFIARFSNIDVKNWMQDSGDWWYDKNAAVGETTDPSSNTDMISPAFWLVRGNEFKITHSDDPQHTALLQTTGDCLGGQTFRSKITSYGDFSNGAVWGSDKPVWGIARFNMEGIITQLNGLQQRNVMGPFRTETRSASGVSMIGVVR